MACGVDTLWSQVMGAPAGFALLDSCFSLALCPDTSASRYPPVLAGTCAQPDALDPVCLAPECLGSPEPLGFLVVSRRWDWGASAVHLLGCQSFLLVL